MKINKFSIIIISLILLCSLGIVSAHENNINTSMNVSNTHNDSTLMQKQIYNLLITVYNNTWRTFIFKERMFTY